MSRPRSFERTPHRLWICNFPADTTGDVARYESCISVEMREAADGSAPGRGKPLPTHPQRDGKKRSHGYSDSSGGRAQVALMIRGIKVAMLTTTAPDGSLHSRPMATQEAEFDGVLWFFTKSGSGKVDEILHDSEVNVSYASPEDHRYVSISGKAALVRDRDKIEEFWSPVYRTWFARRPWRLPRHRPPPRRRPPRRLLGHARRRYGRDADRGRRGR